MTVPKWMLSLLSLGAAAIGALVAGLSVSYKAGEKLTALTVELAHVRETLSPAVITVGVHEARLGVVETRLGYCCQPGSPRAALDWLEPGPVASKGVLQNSSNTMQAIVTNGLHGGLDRGVW